MFTGVIDRKKPSRNVPIKTSYPRRLSILDIPTDAFDLIFIKDGTVTAKITGRECTINAPAIICLDGAKPFELISGAAAEIKVISFLPEFLNSSISIKPIRDVNRTDLCAQHTLYQLSPFFTDDIDKVVIQLPEESGERIDRLIDMISLYSEEQADSYWIFNTRTCFIYIISIVDRLYHEHFMAEPIDFPRNIHMCGELNTLVDYINNHLGEKITLESLHRKFFVNKNKTENLFREYMHTSLQGYLSKRRYEEALYYLRFTAFDGEEIAKRLSFSCSQNFCRFFMKMSGKSPNAVRREARGCANALPRPMSKEVSVGFLKYEGA